MALLRIGVSGRALGLACSSEGCAWVALGNDGRVWEMLGCELVLAGFVATFGFTKGEARRAMGESRSGDDGGDNITFCTRFLGDRRGWGVSGERGGGALGGGSIISISESSERTTFLRLTAGFHGLG